ncbi:deoxyribose-phosphate aldolase [Leucobacter luti]|uniref:Deoxyribose-phosphate aldolase n=1 Tax=Leucobacter luti TaxID=340320 RepID=A0A4Q7U1D0_9MICO|nr:deoxyribose-phosphate aldolase [Leucobacter luti]MBL3698785.1 deoxyribose-phosphate aldolase [Leucobacter luti]RZT66162.1 deoxyribose-phosphate aldolase [Leucobacter luti]
MTVELTDLARAIDHTFLKPEGRRADIEQTVAEAAALGTYSVCVSPSALPLALPEGSTLKVTVVCGFPSGKHHSDVKAAEAALAVSQGADEIDMVIDIGAALDGRFDAVEADISAVRAAVPAPTVLKVIIESAALDDDTITAVCRAAESAGADFVKTSTGFHPAGGASVHAVEVMKRAVGDRVAIKASGGIRDRAGAEAMLRAGASRLGISSSRTVLSGGTSQDTY